MTNKMQLLIQDIVIQYLATMNRQIVIHPEFNRKYTNTFNEHRDLDHKK